MSDLKIILDWPIVDIKKGEYVALGLGLAAAYWWGGGLPGQGQSMMLYAQSYLLGGAVNYVYFKFIVKRPPYNLRGHYGPNPVLNQTPRYGPGPIIAPAPGKPRYAPGPSIRPWDPPM